jgi:hypothetical protein
MEIKIKLGELANIDAKINDSEGKPLPSLAQKILNAPVKDVTGSYWLTRIINKILNELQTLEKTKNKIVMEYVIDEPIKEDSAPDTKPRKIIDPAKLTELNEKLIVLADTETTIDINSKIKLEWLNGIDITNNDLILLDKFIDTEIIK